MSIEDVRRYRNAEPFAPFAIVLRDGKTVRVTHRARIAIAPWGRLSIFEKNVPHAPHINDVVEIRPLDVAA